jgi:hypothetical protein
MRTAQRSDIREWLGTVGSGDREDASRHWKEKKEESSAQPTAQLAVTKQPLAVISIVKQKFSKQRE